MSSAVFVVFDVILSPAPIPLLSADISSDVMYYYSIIND